MGFLENCSQISTIVSFSLNFLKFIRNFLRKDRVFPLFARVLLGKTAALHRFIPFRRDFVACSTIFRVSALFFLKRLRNSTRRTSLVAKFTQQRWGFQQFRTRNLQEARNFCGRSSRLRKRCWFPGTMRAFLQISQLCCARFLRKSRRASCCSSLNCSRYWDFINKLWVFLKFVIIFTILLKIYNKIPNRAF